MTILSTAEDRSEDCSACNIHFHFIDICPGVEVCTLVTLSGTEEIAGHGVIGNLLQCTRYAQGAARHIDGTLTHHVCCLITAIYICQDMTARDIHR